MENNFQKIEDVTLEQWKSVNSENRNIVEEFIRESIQLSDETLKQYYSALKIFYWYVHETVGDKPFYEIKPRDFLMFQNHLIRSGLSSSAVRMKRSAISSLNNYIETYYLDVYTSFRTFVTKGTPPPKQVLIREKNPPTMEEYNTICRVLEEKELWQVLAYFKFSFSSGCRRAEAQQLLKEVVDYVPKVMGEIHVYTTHPIRCKGRGKSGKVRKLNFDQSAMDSIKKWLEVRGQDDCPYVFVSKKNEKYEPLGVSTFNAWSKIYIAPLLGRRFHPHALRSARVTTLVEEQGKSIDVAQKLLGHESSETTKIYLIRDDSDDINEAFD